MIQQTGELENIITTARDRGRPEILITAYLLAYLHKGGVTEGEFVACCVDDVLKAYDWHNNESDHSILPGDLIEMQRALATLWAAIGQ